MDKTIKINLGGTLFQIDEEAYKILRRYLQDIDDRLKNTPGGAETIEDIESRIAEIFPDSGWNRSSDFKGECRSDDFHYRQT